MKNEQNIPTDLMEFLADYDYDNPNNHRIDFDGQSFANYINKAIIWNGQKYSPEDLAWKLNCF